MHETCDVTIVGGGVIGCAIADRLCTEGLQVIIVEAGDKLGDGASSSAMGGIISETDDSCFTPLGEITRHSRRLYPAWLREIEERSGVPVPLLRTGAIQVALDAEEMRRLETRVFPRWAATGSDVRRLGRDELLKREPLLSPQVRGGYLLPSEPALEPVTLMSSLSSALRLHREARVKTGSRAVAVRPDAGGAVVVLDNGVTLRSAAAVIAGGHLSGALIPRLARFLFPVKGEAMEVRPPDHRHAYPLRHHVYSIVDLGGSRCPAYAVPRISGRLSAGVSYDVGVSVPRPTLANQAMIRRGLAALIPAAARWPAIRHCAGIRPATADDLPLVGPADADGRVVLATGHHGLGITLAPATAEMVSAVLGTTPMTPRLRRHLAVCGPGRFMRGGASGAATGLD
ncbi:NAD(P)/FAD-dependent oxidoreductase [Sphaerisporangium dianthi]|uniref:NAD(P)/FAD-dependent oxidoreductase n=1 Tax=Sphaerisporangium dianthi TaxID=1436120 RepID=A0ABV9CRT4_9ACTN